MPELLGVPAEKVNEDRLYRALDALLPHKEELEKHLRQKLGELFALDYDLLLYDVTSTYFEGQANANPLAQRGYSRDHRPDCHWKRSSSISKSCMDGPPGSGCWIVARSRKRTWRFSSRAGAAISSAPRRACSSDMSGSCWPRSGIGSMRGWRCACARLRMAPKCPSFAAAPSAVKRNKPSTRASRRRIEEGLRKIEAACSRHKQNPLLIAQRVGRLLGNNTRAAALFQVQVGADRRGAAHLRWNKSEAWRDWAQLSEGCYLLRSNVVDWSPEELWRAYIQLTEAEDAFHIQKSDLQIRPVWHQKPERVQAHILVCFLAYVLWKTLEAQCRQAGLGDEPRKVFSEKSEIAFVDLLLPTRNGVTLRKRGIGQPNQHQLILLQHLGLRLPAAPEFALV